MWKVLVEEEWIMDDDYKLEEWVWGGKHRRITTGGARRKKKTVEERWVV